MAYSVGYPITIDHTKCGTANSTNFPTLFSGTYDGTGGEPDLRTVANGGGIQHTTTAGGVTVPADLIFASDADGVSPLNWEIEYYNPTTGQIVAWVKIATLDHSTDSVYYLLYNNSSVTTWQGNINGTWDSDFIDVHHYGDGSSLSVADSTASGYNGTITGSVVAVAGKVGGAASFDGSTGYIQDTGFIMPASAGTLECWVYRRDTGNTRVPLYWNGGGDASAPYFSNNSDSTLWANVAPGHNPMKTTNTVAQDTWTHIAFVSGASQGVYVNGVAATLSDAGGGASNFAARTTPLQIGAYGTTQILKWYGYIDEVRISKVIRSASYFLSSYNNQNSPSTFYSIGTAYTPAGGGGGGMLFRAQYDLSGIGGVGKFTQVVG